MNSAVNFIGSADFWNYFVMLLLLAAHVVLFVDLSPIQKRPLCSLNFVFAVLISALVPTLLVPRMNAIGSDARLLSIAVVTVVLSIIITLTIQSVLDINIEF